MSARNGRHGDVHSQYGAQNTHNRRLPHRQKLPDVEQALRYSPFSSIVPFDVNIVPMPDARVPGFSTLFANVSEQEKAQQQLKRLNESLVDSSDPSSSAETTKRELQRLIDPDDITDFNFKTPAKVYRGQNKRQTQTNGHTDPPTRNGLSPLASSILRHTSSGHRYPTPTSFKKQSPASRNAERNVLPSKNSLHPGSELPLPQVVIPPKQANAHLQASRKSAAAQHKPRNDIHNQQTTSGASHKHTTAESQASYGYNQAYNQVPPQTPSKPMVVKAVQIPPPSVTSSINGQYSTGPPPIPRSSTQRQDSVASQTPSVQTPINDSIPIPYTPGYPNVFSQYSSVLKSASKPMVVIPPAPADAADYVTLEMPSPEKVSRKRKRGFGIDLSGQAPEMRDQKAAADTVLHQFSETLEDIFEADNQSQQNPQVFVPIHLEDREIHTITPALHVKLDSYLQKIISYGRFSEVSIEDLLRLHSLSEGAVLFMESQDMDYNSEWNADEFETWIQRLEVADLGLRSARTILRTMSAGREEKQLYSEDLLSAILKAVQKVTDACIIPVVEMRSSSNGGSFDYLSAHKKALSHILHEANKVLGHLAKLLSKQEIAEMIITPVEFFAIRLMFVENASSEKESILGTQRYENMRRTAMDIIAIVFSRYPIQRNFLFDEILTSLQRLPTTRQAARQYRLKDGRPIQLVTALIIQLVQTSSTRAKTQKPTKRKSSALLINGDGTSADMSEEENDASDASESDESDDSKGSDSKVSDAMRKLRHKAIPLCDAPAKSAQHVVGYLMHRAQTSSKSGDQPHRQLLDIFVEDLLLVLGLPDWPGAELLLRAVCARAIHILDNVKSLAPAKNMALELLGMMGSAISDLVAHTRNAVQGLEGHDGESGGHLAQIFEDYAEGSLETSELLMWDGPYHMAVEQYEQASSDDLQAMSAQAYYLAQWSKAVCATSSTSGTDPDKLARRLYTMLSGEEWVTSDNVAGVPAHQCYIAYALTVLNMDFCRHFDYMLKLLIDSVTSEQTTVRSRGLRSVTQMLEKDPSILDRAKNVKAVILKCASDTSPMVRDAALALISKCIALKPSLEMEFLHHVLRLSNDPAVGVRKRSMKLLRDMYLRNSNSDVKAAISDSILRRVQDNDTGVADLAQQTFEEIWLAPFWSIVETLKPDAETDTALRRQVRLMIKTASDDANLSKILASLLKQTNSSNAKNAAANFKVCLILVKATFEMMIDSAQLGDTVEQKHEQKRILETMAIFAKANPRLFTSDQLQILQPYTRNLSSFDDLNRFRPIVVVFRCVLPALSSVEQSLLENVQSSLIQVISKLSKAELNEVAQCLWAINGSLKKPEPLVRTVASVVKNLRGFEATNFEDESKRKDLLRLKKLIQIAGYFGKHCDFEEYLGAFQDLSRSKADTVATLIVQSLEPFTSPSQPLALRASAYDSIGLICQSWPYQFTKPYVSRAFASVLQRGEPVLQEIILTNFRDFFTSVEHQSMPKPEDEKSTNDINTTKLGSSMTANERDSASALISQHFLRDILGIALASEEASALTGTEVIASINRQGLAHPKESGPALVALGTSSNASIAKVAIEEHRILHQQHESMFEREYMRAIYEAFRYQMEVAKDPLGYTLRPLAAKLGNTWEIIKTSKAKYQKKFLSNYCAKIDFDIERLDMSEDLPVSLQFSRFLTENLALFDYTRLEELLHVLSCMERIVGGTGSSVAHNISTDVFHVVVDTDGSADNTNTQYANAIHLTNGDNDKQPSGSQPQISSQASREPVKPARLKQLTTAAIILSTLWEARTFLRRLYGQSASQQRRESTKGKGAAKDLSKAPARVQGVSGEKLVASIAERVASLQNEEAMIKQCQDFVELMSVDNEVKVSVESEESLGDRPETPGLDDEAEDTPMSGASRSMKRKTPGSASNTPSKRRGRPPLNRRKSSSRKSAEAEGSDGDWK